MRPERRGCGGPQAEHSRTGRGGSDELQARRGGLRVTRMGAVRVSPEKGADPWRTRSTIGAANTVVSRARPGPGGIQVLKPRLGAGPARVREALEGVRVPRLPDLTADDPSAFLRVGQRVVPEDAAKPAEGMIKRKSDRPVLRAGGPERPVTVVMPE